MDSTPLEHLPFPEPNDPGNGALDLQILAEAIDAKATIQLAELRTVVNKPIRVTTLTATGGTPVSANSQSDVFIMGAPNWSSLYDSSTSFSLRSESMDGVGTTPGIYRVGCFLITNPTGAVNNGTARHIRIEATVPTSDFTTFPTLTKLQVAYSQCFEASLGSTVQQCELEFATPQPTATDVQITFNHGNTSSTVALLTGSITYMYRVGDVEGI
jgi:hypothetical protein